VEMADFLGEAGRIVDAGFEAAVGLEVTGE
jgi:hypothetical protein